VGGLNLKTTPGWRLMLCFLLLVLMARKSFRLYFLSPSTISWSTPLGSCPCTGNQIQTNIFLLLFFFLFNRKFSLTPGSKSRFAIIIPKFKFLQYRYLMFHPLLISSINLLEFSVKS
jgi:hypothetical protein